MFKLARKSYLSALSPSLTRLNPYRNKLPTLFTHTHTHNTKRCFTSNENPIKLPITMLTTEQEMLRNEIRKFAENEIGPLVKEMEYEQKIADSVIESLFNQGLMGIEVPSEFGGANMSFLDTVIIIEELARVDPSVSAMVDIHNTLINRSIMDYGSSEQKQRFLPLCAQNTVASFCLSEDKSGSDAFSLKTAATQTQNGWEINGNKQWISSSVEANLFIVFATVDPSKKHNGITAFIVDGQSKGLTVGPKLDKLGIKASSTCEVSFDNVFVPNENLLGNVGEGYKIAIGTLNEGRIGIAAQMLGIAEGAFAATFPYLFQRKQFGQFIGDFQSVKFQYAEIATQIEVVRTLIYNAVALKENNYKFTKQASMAKLMASRTAERVASQCIELLGGNGFTTSYPVEKFYRDAKIGSIYEGTSNIQLETIAKLIKKEMLEV